MTLGRTADNAIKIKVEDGTTRAVNCACCGCYPVPELEYNAIAYGGTANLAGTLNSAVKNFSFSQIYSYTIPDANGTFIYGVVNGSGSYSTIIGTIECEVPLPPPFSGTYTITLNLYRYESVNLYILTNSYTPNDTQINPTYQLNATQAHVRVTEDYACDENDPYIPKNKVIYESSAYCGTPLYNWLMQQGPSQPQP